MSEAPEAILEVNTTDRTHTGRNVKPRLCTTIMLNPSVLSEMLGIDNGLGTLWTCMRWMATINLGVAGRDL